MSETTGPMRQPLAIIGIGSIFPKANDTTAFWANIKQGVDAITDVPGTHWSPDDYFDADPKRPDFTYSQRGGFVDPVGFDPMEYGIPPNVLEATDTSQLLGMVAACQAMKDAGYGPDREYNRDRVSTILGVTGALELVVPLGARLGHPIWRKSLRDAGVPEDVIEDVVERISDGYVPWQENSFPGLLGNVVAGRISKHLDLGGTNCVCDAACGSSLAAVHLAAMELYTGKADMVVTGGIDTFNDIFMYMCFSKTPAMSPSGDAKPFDDRADGTIIGEGLGVIVLKRLDDAERDGDKIYALLKGVGSSSDGKGDAIYAPSAKGQMKALRDAYRVAGISPDTIELVEAHGTGTKVGDAIEVSALSEVYRESGAERSWCALGSVKSQIGHTKAAAGAAGMIKAVMALHHKVLPPTIKVKKPNDALTKTSSPFYVNTEPRPWAASQEHPRRAAVSAFGFGGSNYHCVLEEYGAAVPEAQWDGDTQILAYSAETPEELVAKLKTWPVEASWSDVRRRAATSREAFVVVARCRLLLVVERGKSNIRKMLEFASERVQEESDQAWSTPDGVFYGTGKAAGDVAFLFPGQGAQYVGMLRDLACQFPEFQDVLDSQTIDVVYPQPGFDDESKAGQKAKLTATQVAQPAIGAVSMGAYRVMERFGLAPSAVAGHSYGELTALCAAGRLELSELDQFSRLRGSLMADGDGDRGTMLAVRANVKTIENILKEFNIDTTIANKNAPEQTVLSGSTAEIARASDRMKEAGISSTQLNVAAAFHSSFVSGAETPFRKGMAGAEFHAGSVPVYSNTTSRQYPESPDEARKLLASQLANPVEFLQEIRSMHADGVRTFIEVGPGARLTGLVKAILEGEPHEAFALDSSNGKRRGELDLARCLAQAAARGLSVKLAAWDPKSADIEVPAKKAALTVPICGANYRKETPSKPPSQRKTQPQAAEAPSRIPATPASTQPSIASTSVQQVPAGLTEALRTTQENIRALQKLQEQTAQLHQQFLENQESSSGAFKALLEQQQRLLQGGALGAAMPTAPTERAGTEAPHTPKESVPAQAPERSTEAVPQQNGKVRKLLLDIVAEKTGYPVEMLDLDMGLDSDLGIDSIKRVEILSALQEQLPGAPGIESEHLGTLHTLRDVVTHLGGDGDTGDASPGPGQASEEVQGVVLGIVAEKTGYPSDMLDLDMSLDADLGIDSIKRVEILSAVQERVPNAPAVESDQLGTFHTLRDVVAFLADAAPEAAGHAGSSAGPEVQEALLRIVAEKTGYPPDMLELEMSLDGDLGIDSIKRVEILSALQEAIPGIPEMQPEDLGTIQTLGDIVGKLSNGSAPLAAATVSPDVAPVLLAIVADKTGYPQDMLELEMSLDADLGIDSIKRVEILSSLQEQVSGLPELQSDQLGQFNTLGDIVALLSGSVADPQRQAAPAIPEKKVEPMGSTAIERQILSLADLGRQKRSPITLPAGSTVWVTDDGTGLASNICHVLAARQYDAHTIAIERVPSRAIPENLSGLVIVSPPKVRGNFVKQAFDAMQAVGPALRDASESVIATVSRMDGAFGLGDEGIEESYASGGLAGLAKTAAHEWPEVHCKAIDLGSNFDDEVEPATLVVVETLLAGPVEVGLREQGVSALELSVEALSVSEESRPPLEPGDVVVISGGARGVTAEVAITLARACRPTLVLLGRSPAPTAEPDWLAPLADEAAIKRALLEHTNGPKTPKAIGDEYHRHMANREILRNLSRIEEAGGRAAYRPVDIRDSETLVGTLEGVRAEFGPVRGVIHGAGVIYDRLIEEKSRDQFDSVYDTKVGGMEALLKATGDDDLRFIVFFSSSTGRFGRRGQVDYAAGNEVLNKRAQCEARRRPNCRVVSVNWGPWEGGMVTPSLAEVFKKEGIGLIGLKAGAEYLMKEISQRGPVEVVIGAASADEPQVQASSTDSSFLARAVGLEVSLDAFPVLRSHIINGKAVVPFALMSEWLAHGAIHENPGLKFVGFNELRVLKGIILGEQDKARIEVATGKATKDGNVFSVPVEVAGQSDSGNRVIHVSGQVLLATSLPSPEMPLPEPGLEPFIGEVAEVYQDGRLFHGPMLQGIEDVEGCSAEGIIARLRTAASPSEWVGQPLRGQWIADPLALDASFQLMVLWSFERRGIVSLPTYAGRYRQYQRAFPTGGVRAVVRVTTDLEHRARANIDLLDTDTNALVARIQDYECTIDATLNPAFQKNTLTV